MATQFEDIADFLTVPEVAERYRTNENTVRYWRHTGYGPKGVRVGARVLYPRAEIERFDREVFQAEHGQTV
jgi:hypothetical protein